MKPTEFRASLMLLLASVIWGGGFVAGKMALTTLHPFAILVWRFGLASLLCFLLFAKRILKVPSRTAVKGLIIGALQIIALCCQLTGLQYTTSAKQSFLCTAYVALTPFISWILFRRKLTLRAVLTGFLSLAGIGFICLSDTLTLNVGDMLSLAFAVLFGIQVVLTGRFVEKDTDSIQLSFFQFLGAFLVALPCALMRKETFFSFGTASLAGIAYLSVLNTVAAFVLQNIAQKSLRDTTAALIISLESVFGFLFSVLFFRETLTWRFAVGSILCFAAVLMASRAKNAGDR